ncbi:hypothetical protein INT47_000355, partial [Mucor saturninus]
MDMHDQKPFVFNQERIALYSEADYIVKFWASVFETFFGTDEHLFIHWGDTQSSPCKRNNLKINLDMRFMIMKNSKYIMDGANCEYAHKGVYVVEEIAKLRFPTTKKQLREGGIKELVKVLSLLKNWEAEIVVPPNSSDDEEEDEEDEEKEKEKEDEEEEE